MDTEKTIVIFRVWDKLDFGVIALFPDIEADIHGKLCQSYEHVGQHGGADYNHVIQHTRPALKSEYKDLFNELTKAGYNLVVKQRK